MKSTALLTTAYFPPIQYFTKLISFQAVRIEIFETYSKQSFRNRCEIASANGVQSLSVPVAMASFKKIITKKVRISYNTNWQKNHFKSVESAYRSSPYFEYYIDDIQPIWQKKFDYLIDLNEEIIKTILKLLNFSEINIEYTDNYVVNLSDYEDFRNKIHPKDQKKTVDKYFVALPYIQVFEEKYDFNPNLSILDLLFNEGPDAIDYLQKCCKLHYTDNNLTSIV